MLASLGKSEHFALFLPSDRKVGCARKSLSRERDGLSSFEDSSQDVGREIIDTKQNAKIVPAVPMLLGEFGNRFTARALQQLPRLMSFDDELDKCRVSQDR